MQFCENCDNMLYMKVDNTNLVYYCKNCEFELAHDYSTNAKEVSSSSFMNDKTNYSQYITPYIDYDPTLPRRRDIPCKNCEKNGQEVIVIKYDVANMKYLYYCSSCKHFWTFDDNTQPFKA